MFRLAISEGSASTAGKITNLMLLAAVVVLSACTPASPTAAPTIQAVIPAATHAPSVPPAITNTRVPTPSETTEPSPTATSAATPTAPPPTATPLPKIHASCYPDASAPLEDLVTPRGPEHLFDPSCQVSGGVGEITVTWDIDGDGIPESEELDPPPLALQPGEYNPLLTFADEAGQVLRVELPRIVKVGEPRYPTWRYGVHLDYQGGNIAWDRNSLGAVEEQVRLFSAIGIQGVRLDFSWDSLEPADGSYDFGIHDQAARVIRAAGMDILGIIAYTPGWASPSTDSPWNGMPTDLKDFADFVLELTSHYRGQVDNWMIWVEPNCSQSFRSTDPYQYTQLLKSGYVAAKYGNPGSTIILGGLANDESQYISEFRFYPPEGFLQAVYDEGGGDYFDAVGGHPYTHPMYQGYDLMVRRILSIRDVMNSNGDQSKPLYLDEANYGLISDVTEEIQAQWLYEIFRASRQTDVPLVVVYNGRDYGSATTFFETAGLLRKDGSTKPIYHSYADIISQGF